MPTYPRWFVQEAYLRNLSPLKARDLIALCLYDAQKETLGVTSGDSGNASLFEGLVAALREAFSLANDDIHQPTLEGLSRVVALLAQEAQRSGTPPAVIAHHRAQIGLVLSRLALNEQTEIDVTLRERIMSQIKSGELNLPPLPKLAAELHQISQSGDIDLSRAVALVKYDAQVAARVLAVANSAAMAMPGSSPLLNLDDAAIRIGLNGLRRIAFMLTMGEVFRCEALNEHMRAVQQHGFAVGTTVNAACRAARIDPDEGFLAGLLHEIGLHLILATLARLGRRDPAWLRPEVVRRPFLQLHQELGKVIVTHWKLPHAVGDVVAHHHHPERAEPHTQRLAHLVALADAAVEMGTHRSEERGLALAALYSGEPAGLDQIQVRDLGHAVDQALQDETMVNLTS